MYRKNCYCCAKPSNSDAMDVDAALHELGMLSSSTESRKQFLSERNRTKSESATTSMLRKATESANANQNGYQIIEINPTFVTGFMSEIVHPCAESSSSSSSSQQSPPHRGNYSGYVPRALGNSYRNEPDSLEKDVKLHRLARIKLGRQRRFRKPYEVPWRLHHSLPLPDTQPDSPIDNRPPDSSELSIDTTTTTAGAVTSPTSAPSKSNNSSPVKIPTLVIHRSKSLDDLDLARLKISELTQDQNFISQRQEIDQMSQNFKDLQMKE